MIATLQTTAAMISMSFITVMTGFFAMNLRNGLPQPVGYQHSYTVYYAVSSPPPRSLPGYCITSPVREPSTAADWSRDGVKQWCPL